MADNKIQKTIKYDDFRGETGLKDYGKNDVSSSCNFNVRLGLLNIRSIVSKYDRIYEIIHDGLDLLILTETWHRSHDEISVRWAMPPYYNFIDFVRPHDPHHGGIIIYFRNNFCGKKIELPIMTTFESLALKLTIDNSNVVLLSIYRPGSAPISPLFYDELINLFDIITMMSCNIVIAGDFNVHMERFDDHHTVSLLDLFDIFGLKNSH